MIKKHKSFSSYICTSLCFVLLILHHKSTAQSYSKSTKIFDLFEISIDIKKDKLIQSIEKPLQVSFTAPSGKITQVDAFWDGEFNWKIRFMPEELGQYKFYFLNQNKVKKYSFKSIKNNSKFAVYTKGKIIHQKGNYHLSHHDGSPFFYLGCTAWNGALRSTDEEWDVYLEHRKTNNFNVIQFVTTDWRGFPMDYFDIKPYEIKDSILINPKYFQKLDEKFLQINQKGLIAAPIILWAWTNPGNPGNDLSIKNAVKLAKYIKARYDAFHVLWNLAGDGDYLGKYEQRWKEIGKQVFGNTNENQSLVTLHPRGFQWYAQAYNMENWINYFSYQTGHVNSSFTAKWKSNGPLANQWNDLIPRPFIDTEPVYEHPGQNNNANEVRKSILQSLFSGPIAGTGYGAWTTWPWLRKNETSINHGMTKPTAYDWKDGIESTASKQLAHLYRFMNTLEWWKFRPLVKNFIVELEYEKDNPIFILSTENNKQLLVYFTSNGIFKIRNQHPNLKFQANWFNPSNAEIKSAEIKNTQRFIEVNRMELSDAILHVKYY